MTKRHTCGCPVGEKAPQPPAGALWRGEKRTLGCPSSSRGLSASWDPPRAPARFASRHSPPFRAVTTSAPPGATPPPPVTASHPFATRAMASDTSTHVPPRAGREQALRRRARRGQVRSDHRARPAASARPPRRGSPSSDAASSSPRDAKIASTPSRKKLAKDYGTKVHCVALDVTDVDAVMSLPSQLPDDFKDVSILVNNAGGALGTAKCTENNMDDVSVMLDANVKGCHRVHPRVFTRDGGARVRPRGEHLVHRGRRVVRRRVRVLRHQSRHQRVHLRVQKGPPRQPRARSRPSRRASSTPSSPPFGFKGDTTKAENVYAGMKYGGAADRGGYRG